MAGRSRALPASTAAAAMAEVPESTAAAMTEATARSAETMTTLSAAEQPRLQLRRQFRLQLVQRYAAEAVSARTLYRRSGPGSTTISFSDMPFSCNFSDPCANVLFSNNSALCSSNSSLCFSGPVSASAAAPPALHHQYWGQHRNISDGRQTVPMQNHPAVQPRVSIGGCCSN